MDGWHVKAYRNGQLVQQRGPYKGKPLPTLIRKVLYGCFKGRKVTVTEYAVGE